MHKKPSSRKNSSEKEPDLINKISPRRSESADPPPISKVNGNAAVASVAAPPPKQAAQSSSKTTSIQEIIGILERPTTFEINYTAQQQQLSQANQSTAARRNSGGSNSSESKTSTSFTRPSTTSNSIVVNEVDIPKYIESCIESGLKHLSSAQLKDAVVQLRNAEILIDTYMQKSDGKVSADLMLGVVLNLGVCFYKVGLFDEAYSCFENSDMRIKKRISDMKAKYKMEFVSAPAFQRPLLWVADVMPLNRLRLELNMQMCILFSEIGKHEDALDFAKKSAKLAVHLLLDTRNIALALTYAHNQAAATSANKNVNHQLDSSEQLEEIIVLLQEKMARSSVVDVDDFEDTNKKWMSILNFICNNFQVLREGLSAKYPAKIELANSIKSLIQQQQQQHAYTDELEKPPVLSSSECGLTQDDDCSSDCTVDMYFVINKVTQQQDKHWLLNSNILSLLQMKPCAFSEIVALSQPQIVKELNLDILLRKIVDTAVGFYCISTESRFIEESLFMNNPNLTYSVANSEFWLGKSLEIAYALIPQDAPMISQIINVYTRFHGIEKQIIPEDEHFPEQVKLLKPQKGVNITSSAVAALRANFFIPAIRTALPPLRELSNNDEINNSNHFTPESVSPARNVGDYQMIKTNQTQFDRVDQESDSKSVSNAHEFATNKEEIQAIVTPPPQPMSVAVATGSVSKPRTPQPNASVAAVTIPQTITAANTTTTTTTTSTTTSNSNCNTVAAHATLNTVASGSKKVKGSLLFDPNKDIDVNISDDEEFSNAPPTFDQPIPQTSESHLVDLKHTSNVQLLQQAPLAKKRLAAAQGDHSVQLKIRPSIPLASSVVEQRSASMGNPFSAPTSGTSTSAMQNKRLSLHQDSQQLQDIILHAVISNNTSNSVQTKDKRKKSTSHATANPSSAEKSQQQQLHTTTIIKHKQQQQQQQSFQSKTLVTTTSTAPDSSNIVTTEASVTTRDREQQILSKIEALVKKQRPQSSSVHESSTTSTSSSSNNNNLLNQPIKKHSVSIHSKPTVANNVQSSSKENHSFITESAISSASKGSGASFLKATVIPNLLETKSTCLTEPSESYSKQLSSSLTPSMNQKTPQQQLLGFADTNIIIAASKQVKKPQQIVTVPPQQKSPNPTNSLPVSTSNKNSAVGNNNNNNNHTFLQSFNQLFSSETAKQQHQAHSQEPRKNSESSIWPAELSTQQQSLNKRNILKQNFFDGQQQQQRQNTQIDGQQQVSSNVFSSGIKSAKNNSSQQPMRHSSEPQAGLITLQTHSKQLSINCNPIADSFVINGNLTTTHASAASTTATSTTSQGSAAAAGLIYLPRSFSQEAKGQKLQANREREKEKEKKQLLMLKQQQQQLSSQSQQHHRDSDWQILQQQQQQQSSALAVRTEHSSQERFLKQIEVASKMKPVVLSQKRHHSSGRSGSKPQQLSNPLNGFGNEFLDRDQQHQTGFTIITQSSNNASSSSAQGGFMKTTGSIGFSQQTRANTRQAHQRQMVMNNISFNQQFPASTTTAMKSPQMNLSVPRGSQQLNAAAGKSSQLNSTMNSVNAGGASSSEKVRRDSHHQLGGRKDSQTRPQQQQQQQQQYDLQQLQQHQQHLDLMKKVIMEAPKRDESVERKRRIRMELNSSSAMVSLTESDVGGGRAKTRVAGERPLTSQNAGTRVKTMV